MNGLAMILLVDLYSIIYVNGNQIRSKHSVNCDLLCHPDEGLPDSCFKYCKDYISSRTHTTPKSQPKSSANTFPTRATSSAHKPPARDTTQAPAAKNFQWPIIVAISAAVCAFLLISGIAIILCRYREIRKRQKPVFAGRCCFLHHPIPVDDIDGSAELATSSSCRS